MTSIHEEMRRKAARPNPFDQSEVQRVRGHHVTIYKPARGSDCTNGGVTANATDAIVVVSEREAERDRLPEWRVDEHTCVLRLVERRQFGPYLQPVDGDVHGRAIGPMAGGNYAGSYDSRWRAFLREHGCDADLVAVHDRYETQEEYDILSR